MPLQYINSLFKTYRSDVSVETYWLPTPRNPGSPSNHTPIQNRILTELYALEEIKRLDPQTNQKSRYQRLSDFDWTNSTLTQQTEASIEDLLVQFNEFLARHLLDIGIKK